MAGRRIIAGLFYVGKLGTEAHAGSERDWELYKATFGKSYSDAGWGTTEDARKEMIFQQNMDRIERENGRGNNTHKLGWTEFTDWTTEEFENKYLMSKVPHVPDAKSLNAPPFQSIVGASKVPHAKNWKDELTTPVKAQKCGDCWANSAVEMIESRYMWYYGKQPPPLSMQQVIDCQSKGTCKGGWPENVYDYAIETGGLEPISSYPYDGETHSCTYDCNKVFANDGIMISRWWMTNQWHEEGMKNYVGQYGPLSVCGKVKGSFDQNYKDGVINAPDNPAVDHFTDHCFQITGYDLMDGDGRLTFQNMDSQNMCIDIQSGGTDAGTRVQLYECNGTPAQEWHFAESAVVNSRSRKCLDIKNAVMDNETPLQIWDCNGTPAQQWELTRDGSLRNIGSGKCVDVPNGNLANSNPLQLYECNGTPAQRWSPPQSKGYWWIRNSWGTWWGIEGYAKLQYGVMSHMIASHPTDVMISSLKDSACSVQCGSSYCGCPCGPKYNKCGQNTCLWGEFGSEKGANFSVPVLRPSSSFGSGTIVV